MNQVVTPNVRQGDTFEASNLTWKVTAFTPGDNSITELKLVSTGDPTICHYDIVNSQPPRHIEITSTK